MKLAEINNDRWKSQVADKSDKWLVLVEIMSIILSFTRETCRKHSILILSDEIYARIHFTGQHVCVSKVSPKCEVKRIFGFFGELLVHLSQSSALSNIDSSMK